ncbi:hypothetical protein O1L60_35430 [Streptomyces diastatochromogenes]|nr:hypothetical protein [Streptomyces diastatochromogenes]
MPTVMSMCMMRVLATRATYRMSSPSRTATDADSWTRRTSATRCGVAISGRLRPEIRA